jgi:hypothetical protein
MRRCTLRIACLLSLALLANPILGRAAARWPQGAGGWVCEAVYAGHGSPERIRQSEQWVLGYLTARVADNDRASAGRLGGPDGIALHLARYCRDHRQAQIADAAVALYRETLR